MANSFQRKGNQKKKMFPNQSQKQKIKEEVKQIY